MLVPPPHHIILKGLTPTSWRWPARSHAVGHIGNRIEPAAGSIGTRRLSIWVTVRERRRPTEGLLIWTSTVMQIVACIAPYKVESSGYSRCSIGAERDYANGVTAQWHLLDLDEHRLANTFEFLSAHVSLKTRRTAEFAPEVAAMLDTEIGAADRLAWDAPLSGALRLRRRPEHCPAVACSTSEQGHDDGQRPVPAIQR